MIDNFNVMIVMNEDTQKKFDTLVKKWNDRTDFEHGIISKDVVMGDLIFKFFDINNALDRMLS